MGNSWVIYIVRLNEDGNSIGGCSNWGWKWKRVLISSVLLLLDGWCGFQKAICSARCADAGWQQFVLCLLHSLTTAHNILDICLVITCRASFLDTYCMILVIAALGKNGRQAFPSSTIINLLYSNMLVLYCQDCTSYERFSDNIPREMLS